MARFTLRQSGGGSALRNGGSLRGPDREGTLAQTLGDVILSAIGTVAIAATLAVTLEDVALAGTGEVGRVGTLSVTLDDVTLSASGTTAIAGSAAITLDDVTLSWDRLAILHEFPGVGAFSPLGPLCLADDGNFYGLTAFGGANNMGVFYKLTPDGTFSVLLDLEDIVGANPKGIAPVQGSDGDFYFPTSNGFDDGSEDDDGIIIKVTATGTPTRLHLLVGSTDGKNPRGGLVEATDGNFYGRTNAGGAHGKGTIYQVTPSGTFSVLRALDTGDGYNFASFDQPGPLVQGSDGDLYGVSNSGGAHSRGTIFKITLGGSYSVLYDFTVSDSNPGDGGLLEVGTDAFYGTTQSPGGDLSVGTLFKYDGSFTRLASFDFDTSGSNPVGALVDAGDGSLYGITHVDGALFYGTVFRFDINSSALTPSWSFDGVALGLPVGGLVRSGGLLYGVTDQSGVGAGLDHVYRLALKANNVLVSGILSVTLDDVTLVATGTVADPVRTGALAVTLDDVTLVGAGTAEISGALASTLDSVTLAATGSAPVTGSLASTLGDVVLAAEGTVLVSGALASTLDPVTLSATGQVPVSAALASTLEDVVLAGTGVTPITGSLSTTLDDVTLAGTGLVVSGLVGNLNVTLDDITLAAIGTVPILGAATPTIDPVTLAGTGTVAVVGSASIALSDISASGTGTVAVSGAASIALDPVTLSAAGTVGWPVLVGTLSVTLDDVTVSGQGVAPVQGGASITLDPVTLAGTGAVPVVGTLSRQLGDITLVGTATAPITGIAEATLDDVMLAAFGGVRITGVATMTLDLVTLAATGHVQTLGVIEGVLDLTLGDVTLRGRGIVRKTHHTIEVLPRSGASLVALVATGGSTSVNPSFGTRQTIKEDPL